VLLSGTDPDVDRSTALMSRIGAVRGGVDRERTPNRPPRDRVGWVASRWTLSRSVGVNKCGVEGSA
jgi:hypothetical protein